MGRHKKYKTVSIPREQLLRLFSNRNAYIVVDAIGQYQCPDLPIEDIIPLLKHPVAGVKIAVMKVIENRGDINLLIPFKKSVQKNVANFANKALLKLEKVETTIRTTNADAQIQALGLLESSNIGLATDALSSPNWRVRKAAVRAIREHGDISGIISLLDDPAPQVRRAAIIAVERKGDVSCLKKCLTDVDSGVAANAAKAMARKININIDTTQYNKKVTEIILEETKERVKKEREKEYREPDKAITLPDGKVVKGGRGMAKVRFVTVDAAKSALAAGGCKLADKLAAIKVIGKTGSDEDVKGLLPLLSEKQERIRASVAKAIAMHPGMIGEYVDSFLTDSNAQIKKVGLVAIRQSGNVENLISLLADPDPKVRKAAIVAVRGKVDLKVLAPLTEDSDPKVRAAAEKAVAKLVKVKKAKKVEEKAE